MNQPTSYAIIRTGGKQYRVRPEQNIRVETVEGDAGTDVTFSDVLFVQDGENTHIGRPLVAGASVTGKIVRQFRDKKV